MPSSPNITIYCIIPVGTPGQPHPTINRCDRLPTLHALNLIILGLFARSKHGGSHCTWRRKDIDTSGTCSFEENRKFKEVQNKAGFPNMYKITSRFFYLLRIGREENGSANNTQSIDNKKHTSSSWPCSMRAKQELQSRTSTNDESLTPSENCEKSHSRNRTQMWC